MNQTPYLEGNETYGAGGTTGSGDEPHEAQRAAPATAARIRIVFIIYIMLLLIN